jgi:hypothetical protein
MKFNELSHVFRNAASNFAHWNIGAIFWMVEIPHRGTLFSRVKNGLDWPGQNGRQKKSPLRERAESIFLEEDRGDRKHDAASHKNRPMTFRDGRHPAGACLSAGAAQRRGRRHRVGRV